MPYPRPPGVYFEPADPPSWSVTEVRSDIAGFVGLADRGPLHVPIRVENWTQFTTRFGGRFLSYAWLPDAVHGFFANGGRTAWIVRVGRPVGIEQHATIHLVNGNNDPLFLVRARDPGLRGGSLSLRVTPGTQQRFHLQVVAPDGVVEMWRDLEGIRSTGSSQTVRRFIGDVINGRNGDSGEDLRLPVRLRDSGSFLISVQDLNRDDLTDRRVMGVQRRAANAAKNLATESLRSGGFLGWEDESPAGAPWQERSVLSSLTLEHFLGNSELPDQAWGLSTLEAVDDVSLVAIPDLVWTRPRANPSPPKPRRCQPQTVEPPPPAPLEERIPFSLDIQRSGQLALLGHCLRLKDRFAIIDPPADLSPDGAAAWADVLHSFAGQYGALYYPWVKVPAEAAPVRTMPPSGHLAGLFARVDLRDGVQKSPANEVLTEVHGVEREVDDETHGCLNLAGVNVLRPTAARGIRVMGARTLIDTRDPDLQQWQFVAVRRLLLMLEESLEEATYWLVHTDNSPERWRDVERVVRNFLLTEWRLGRLDGTSPEQAFSVECSAATNPISDVEGGRMTCVIGVQPPLPSEFVLIRLGERGGETGAWNLGESRG